MEKVKLSALDRFSFYIGTVKNKEKIVLKTGKRNSHFTVDLGLKSKIADIHKTDEIQKRHGASPEVLYAARHFTLGRALIFMKNTFLPVLHSNIETVNVEFLKKKNWILYGLDNISQDKFLKETRNEFSFLPEIEASILDEMTACYQCIHEHPSNTFLVYKWKRRKLEMIGCLLKNDVLVQNNEYLYFGLPRFKALISDLKPKLEEYFKDEFSSEKQAILKQELNTFINELKQK